MGVSFGGAYTHVVNDYYFLVLTFAPCSFLGPAEVVVWGVLGALWGSIEALIESNVLRGPETA